MTEPANKKASPYPLRLDESLKQWTEERAKRNGRSMNAEIIQILKEAKARETEQVYFTACMESGIEPIIKTEK